MFSSERYRKARKCYRDFPFLWAVIPTLNAELEIKIKRVDEIVVGHWVLPRMRWWLHYSLDGVIEEVREIVSIKRHNLASEIIASLGVLADKALIQHLVSVEETGGFVREVTVYRPFRDGVREIPILDLCHKKIAVL